MLQGYISKFLGNQSSIDAALAQAAFEWNKIRDVSQVSAPAPDIAGAYDNA